MRERIKVVEGDITHQRVDAVVNAANTTLLGGDGVDGAIHRAAGPRLMDECRSLGGCPTGEAKITRGYDLPALWVIHAVGPVWRGGGYGEEAQLAACYRNSLHLAEHHGICSIAFPAISTGAYRFPLEGAAPIAARTVLTFLRQHDLPRQVILVCWNRQAYTRFSRAVEAALAEPSIY